jgi:transposase
MAKEKFIENTREKFKTLQMYLNENTIRIWSALESQFFGRGGVSFVSEATGLSRTTIYEGIREVNSKNFVKQAEHAKERIRREGGGRKSIRETYPNIEAILETMLEPVTRGDPESPLLWTCKSTHKIAQQLEETKGIKISQRAVCDLLGEMGYSLQSNRKTNEGGNHEDRDAQFYYIYGKVKEFQRRQAPVISVDTKKKEMIGEYKNNGQEYHEKGNPVKVNVYDFVDKEMGKVSPCGIYDQTNNLGYVNVGIDHDTAEFAVESIRRWWREMGSELYKDAKELMITADCGGSNGNRNRLWKYELQKFSNETKLKIRVCHFPPGTSKWNKIEHKMFCHISKNWRGRPLTSREVVVNLISNTSTTKGLKITARLDENNYEPGKKNSDDMINEIKLKRAKFHGEWNYKISPND